MIGPFKKKYIILFSKKWILQFAIIEECYVLYTSFFNSHIFKNRTFFWIILLESRGINFERFAYRIISIASILYIDIFDLVVYPNNFSRPVYCNNIFLLQENYLADLYLATKASFEDDCFCQLSRKRPM